MPVYNFKAEFVAAIEAGTKRQTIRPRRKRRTRPGDRLHLFTGMRTKRCRKLSVVVCKSIEPIEIDPYYIRISGRVLSIDEKRALARADGFESLGHFYDFFQVLYGVPHDVELELIRW